MEDALSMLRKYVINKKSIAIVGDDIIFDRTYFWPADTKTNYIIHGSGKNEVPIDYYTLRALVFFIQRKHLQHSRYVSEAVKENVQVVQRPNRKDLLAFLNGEIATSPSIDKSILLKTLSLEELKCPQPVKLIVAKKRNASCTEEELENEIAKIKKRRLYYVDPSPVNMNTSEDNMIVGDIISNEASPESDTIMTVTDKGNQQINDKAIVEDGNISEDDDLQITYESIKSIENFSSYTPSARNRNTILQSENMEFATKTFKTLQNIERFERYGKRAEQLHHSDHLSTSDYSSNDNSEIQTGNESISDRSLERNTSIPHEAVSFTSVEDNINLMPPQKIINYAREKRSICPNNCLNISPIIVISSSNLSLITMVNAVDILQKLTFVPKEEKCSNSNRNKENEIKINRNSFDGRFTSYRVVADPLKLNPRDWNNIIAIFVVGTTWQFKNWPIYGGNPVDIFSNVSAFHLKYDDAPLNVNIQRWRINVINISRTKQHCNRMALMQFWSTVDTELKKNRRCLH